ncbi:hypothetical protein BJ875DRAFT_93216 [Amylocarpus encephaloides]|uniref:Uncharacterized protein n=1 Tax=Amylocarpus encephaloides TaxID=45428 RepID=A0A9P7YEE6_9HELO|nr:hypothetical protein BJ875DRAFT_93216 [Amylocarpus encephaloides]
MSTLSPSPQRPHSSSVSPLKRKAMSVTQTYYLAHTARGKLSTEAGRSDHNLRLLVGHANLLDSLMLELAAAEQEQESWFNQSVKKASKTAEEPRHIQWADAIVEDPEEDWQAEDADSSDSESEYDSDEEMAMEGLQRVSSHRVEVEAEEVDEDFEDLEDEAYAALSLHRTPSHSASASSPPELDDDSDSSEDDAMPPSPPFASLPAFSDKQRRQIATTSLYSKSSGESQVSIPASEQEAFFEEGFYLPPRTPGLVSAISVY